MKLSLETATVSLSPTSYIYNGTSKTPTVTVTRGRATVDAVEYDISYSNTNGGDGNHTNAGTVTVKVTAKADGDYYGSCSTTFTIAQKSPTPTITGTTTKTYDGTNAAPAGLAIRLTGVVGNDNVTAMASSYAYNSADVNTATTITASGITLSGGAAGNYVLSSNTASIDGTITKDTSATAPAAGEGYTLDYPAETITVKDGYEVSTANDGTGTKSAVTGGSTFIDVVSGQWYTPAITWAAANSIVGGYGNGLFGPNDNITREQLAVMLWRYAGSPAATDKELHFSDADQALGWASANGIINGKGDGILDPQGLATRAQVAQMLQNFLSK